MSYVAGTVLDDTGAAASGRTVRVYRRDTGALLGETATASGSVTWDADFGSVVLLLHGNGTNNSTTITDSSFSAKTVTAYGDAKISTTQSKFGGSSITFDGTGDYLSTTHNDFAFGTGDFTVEMWFYISSLTAGYSHLIDTRTADSNGFGLGVEADGKVFLFSINAFRVEAGSVSTATWYHIAVSRASGVTKVFLSGTQVGADWSASTDYTQTTYLFGKYYGGSLYALNGYIDDIRITKGVARYTANFTPPAAAFGDAVVSLSAGGFAVPTSYTGEVNVVCLDDASGTTYNDKILRTTPV